MRILVTFVDFGLVLGDFGTVIVRFRAAIGRFRAVFGRFRAVIGRFGLAFGIVALMSADIGGAHRGSVALDAAVPIDGLGVAVHAVDGLGVAVDAVDGPIVAIVGLVVVGIREVLVELVRPHREVGLVPARRRTREYKSLRKKNEKKRKNLMLCVFSA